MGFIGNCRVQKKALLLKLSNYKELLICALEVVSSKQITLKRTWYTKIL